MGLTCTVTDTHRYVDKDCWCHNYDHEINGCRRFMVAFDGMNEKCYSTTEASEKVGTKMTKLLSDEMYKQAGEEVDRKLSHMQKIIIESISEKERDKLFEEVEFTVKCKMRRRWAIQFLSMLKCMQYYGGLGCSREVGMYADGDGDYHPKFEWDIDIDSDANPVRDEDGNKLYDAG